MSSTQKHTLSAFSYFFTVLINKTANIWWRTDMREDRYLMKCVHVSTSYKKMENVYWFYIMQIVLHKIQILDTVSLRPSISQVNGRGNYWFVVTHEKMLQLLQSHNLFRNDSHTRVKWMRRQPRKWQSSVETITQKSIFLICLPKWWWWQHFLFFWHKRTCTCVHIYYWNGKHRNHFAERGQVCKALSSIFPLYFRHFFHFFLVFCKNILITGSRVRTWWNRDHNYYYCMCKNIYMSSVFIYGHKQQKMVFLDADICRKKNGLIKHWSKVHFSPFSFLSSFQIPRGRVYRMKEFSEGTIFLVSWGGKVEGCSAVQFIREERRITWN